MALLRQVSEYMSALFEFLDWWWPDLGWEEHRQAIILSKRFLQPLSPLNYQQAMVSPQVRAAWTTFTYCFFHGTGHLPQGGPTEAKAWLTRMVGEQGFNQDGAIVTAIRAWIASMRPRIQAGCGAIDQPRSRKCSAAACRCLLTPVRRSRYHACNLLHMCCHVAICTDPPPPSHTRRSMTTRAKTSLGTPLSLQAPRHAVHSRAAQANAQSNCAPIAQEQYPQLDLTQPALRGNWPDPEVYHRVCEKRGAVKRQQEEEFPVRFPLRVTAGRAKVGEAACPQADWHACRECLAWCVYKTCMARTRARRVRRGRLQLQPVPRGLGAVAGWVNRCAAPFRTGLGPPGQQQPAGGGWGEQWLVERLVSLHGRTALRALWR